MSSDARGSADQDKQIPRLHTHSYGMKNHASHKQVKVTDIVPSGYYTYISLVLSHVGTQGEEQ